MLVHVETSDSDCGRSYSSDDSSASTSSSKKKVHFDDTPPKKSALKTKAHGKGSRDSDASSEHHSSKRGEWCCSSCSEREGEWRNKPQKNYKNSSQQTPSCQNNNPSHQNKTENNQHQQQDQQRNQTARGQSQNNQQSSSEHRSGYLKNIHLPSNWQARLSYLHRHMASPRSIMPSKAMVVLREDVIECPSDPRPNAFFDNRTGILRVYHGSVYGNPFATLMPNPASHMPIGSFAPSAGQFSAAAPSEPRRRSAKRSPATDHHISNNSWGNDQNPQQTVPGSWPADNNDGHQSSSGWTSGWGNNNNNNDNSSGYDAWGEHVQHADDNNNNENSSNWGGDDGNNQADGWGSGGANGSNDNQQTNQSWGDDSNNNTSPKHDVNSASNEDAWGQPITTAPWGDMSAAQSTQSNGNNNNNSGDSWGGGNDNNNSNSNWTSSGQSWVREITVRRMIAGVLLVPMEIALEMEDITRAPPTAGKHLCFSVKDSITMLLFPAPNDANHMDISVNGLLAYGTSLFS